MSGEDLRHEIEQAASRSQYRAARPDSSVWVAASAGTGKTKVLIDRVLSLLLDGTAPERILCLTFTKAAAAEMANRLAVVLERWVAGSAEDLAGELRRLTGEEPDDALLDRARGLFARVLDVPGGLKILTIHAFCQSLLGRFPLEAGVSPNFQVLEERTAAEMLAAAREEVLARARRDGDEVLAAALEQVSTQCHDMGFIALVQELIYERARFARALLRHGGVAGLRSAIFAVLEADPEATEDGLLRAACAEGAFDQAALQAVAAAMLDGSKTDHDHGLVILDWLGDPAQRAESWERYLAAFFTEGGQGDRRKKLVHKAAVVKAPEAEAVLDREADRLERIRGGLQSLAVAHSTLALLTIGSAILDTYEDHKQARGLLDYDDLILKTRDLLSGTDAAAWVLFKLDGGLDHVLVDEAQDTNPEQWEVLGRLTEEFFAGEGARPAPRTVFAVGDAKQSIYSFQRAKPEEFAHMRAHFSKRVRAVEQLWDQIDLEVCFRSTAPVLQAVDRVFREDPARQGLFLDDGDLHHQPVRIGEAGLVELWPAVKPLDAVPSEPWSPPVARETEQQPVLRLANLIARKIWHWTLSDSGGADPAAWLESRGRRLRPGDFLVLVRRRNEFVEALVRALKELDVPVAGVDRMLLTEQLAIMDLVALGRVLLLPEDDLTLATVLKGPFLGLTETQLFELAHGREGTLWDALGRRSNQEPAFADCHRRLSELRARTDLLRPYELYARLLGPEGGRTQLLARLGPEAADPIDEFLALALAHEREHVPSLESFLHWLTSGNPEVKRDLEHGQNAVRVMTVHGAKGLQAPVVVLPDTLQTPRPQTGLLWLDDADLVIWPLRKAYDGAAAGQARSALKTRQDEEYRRLLYVAMTRAEDRLYLCGWETRQNAPADCWYNLVKQGLEDLAEPVAFDFRVESPEDPAVASTAGDWSGPGLRLAGAQTVEAKDHVEQFTSLPRVGELPDWVRLTAPAEPSPPRPLAPSRPDQDEPAVQSPLGPDAGARFRRGVIIHRLLETLPNLPPARREAAARRYLARPTHDLSEGQQAEIHRETLRVLEDERLSALFGSSSRAEVPIVGLLETSRGPEVVSGQIDRLLIEENRILIVDYKSNRPAPLEESEVPDLYFRQMASYRSLLAPIYPEKTIDCYLLWTEVPRLMQLSDVMLTHHAP